MIPSSQSPSNDAPSPHSEDTSSPDGDVHELVPGIEEDPLMVGGRLRHFSQDWHHASSVDPSNSIGETTPLVLTEPSAASCAQRPCADRPMPVSFRRVCPERGDHYSGVSLIDVGLHRRSRYLDSDPVGMCGRNSADVHGSPESRIFTQPPQVAAPTDSVPSLVRDRLAHDDRHCHPST